MASLLRWLPRFCFQPSLQPRSFTNPNFTRIASNLKIEEETIPDYLSLRYYPVVIGEVFHERYQVVGKLGFGAYSTVWLAHDLRCREHVALKVFIRAQALGDHVDNEIKMYQRMEQCPSDHPGRQAVRSLLDAFHVTSPDGEHQCLVHPPLWDSVQAVVRRNPTPRLPTAALRFVLKDLFLALDFLHKECKIIHTDIKADNIMFGVHDDSIFSDFEEEELQNPSPRKEVDGRTIYASRNLRAPKGLGPPVLCDFGAAVAGDEENTECVQPDIYRSPEVLLEASWDYKIDIWNSGCMIWDMYEDRHLFQGIDPEHKTYRRRAHLAEMIAILGPPPKSLLDRGAWTSKFFSEDGVFTAGIDIPPSTSLGDTETNLMGGDKKEFINFMEKMIQWAPEQRSSAEDLYSDPWLQKKA